MWACTDFKLMPVRSTMRSTRSLLIWRLPWRISLMTEACSPNSAARSPSRDSFFFVLMWSNKVPELSAPGIRLMGLSRWLIARESLHVLFHCARKTFSRAANIYVDRCFRCLYIRLRWNRTNNTTIEDDMPPVIFPTKPWPRAVRMAIAAWQFYERHQFDVVLALLAVAFLCLAGAQVADAFDRYVP